MITKLGHVGIYCKDLPALRRFYSEVVGLTISDEDAHMGVVFMTADPDREHHEFVLFSGKEHDGPSVQQLSFSCESLQDVVDYYHRFKEHNVRFDRVVSHGNAIGLYFFDPEGNRCEVYWTTPFKARQPYAEAIDVTRPLEEVMAQVEASVREHAATGHRDPASFARQKEQLAAEGIRV